MPQDKKIHSAFSIRLIKLMKEAGYLSKRGVGVRLSDLSMAADCTPEMARRYLAGEALPDYRKVIKIAQWLKTNPGDLLFGIEHNYNVLCQETVTDGIVFYILKVALHTAKKVKEKDLQDLIETTYDVIHDSELIEGDMAVKKKMIDQSFSAFTPNKRIETGKIKHA